MQSDTAYIMYTTRHNQYELAADGRVLGRSNGPQGWDYSGKWIILGAAMRHHSRRIMALAAITADGVPGHGIIHDLDHGTRRVWGNERMVTLRAVR